jgi:hypothetical protein
MAFPAAKFRAQVEFKVAVEEVKPLPLLAGDDSR